MQKKRDMTPNMVPRLNVIDKDACDHRQAIKRRRSSLRIPQINSNPINPI